MTDKTLTCADCRQQFIFQVGEQTFFKSKGLNDPKRCKPCRVKAKARREGSLPQETVRDQREGRGYGPGE